MSRQERDNTQETIERTTSTSTSGPTPVPPPTTSVPPTGTRVGEVREVRQRETTSGPVTWEEIREITREAPSRLPLRTWRPVVGGVLAMIAGIWNIIIGAGIILGAIVLDVVSPSFLWGFGTFAIFGNAAGIALIVTGAVSTIGGILAANRRSWNLAMIGVIMSLIPSPVILPFFMGIASTTLVAMSKREFVERLDTDYTKLDREYNK